MISIRDLHFVRSVQQPPTLCNISLEANPGEVLCILGPNGAGKSTLLNCLFGNERRWTGQIHLDGIDVRILSRSHTAKLCSYVPQFSSSAFSFSAFEYVLLGRTPHIAIGKSPGRTDLAAAESAMCRVGMERFKNRPLDELSGGERQLILIARALAQETPIIFLDEPTASLDLGNQAKVLQMVLDLAGLGRTVLMTTHLPEHAFLLGARVAAIKAGSVVAAGTAAEVCSESLLEHLYGAPMQLLRNDGPQQVAACVPRLTPGS
jgi:iron complex transport system ATP-binding protein